MSHLGPSNCSRPRGPSIALPCARSLFDEIDAALDTQRTQALAQHMLAEKGAQSIFVSHRQPLIEGAPCLVGTYSLGGARSRAVSVFFGKA